MRYLFLVSFLIITGPAIAQNCSVDCPIDAVDEGEPAIVEGYVDSYNGGCYSNPPAFQVIDWINDDDGLPPYEGNAWLCGNMGWDLSQPAGEKWADTDWFVVQALETGMMEFTFEPEHPCWIYKITQPTCGETIQVENSRLGECGNPATLSFPVTAGEEIYLIVHPPSAAQDLVPEFTYFAVFSNVSFISVPVKELNWGTLKSLYR